MGEMFSVWLRTFLNYRWGEPCAASLFGNSQKKGKKAERRACGIAKDARFQSLTYRITHTALRIHLLLPTHTHKHRSSHSLDELLQSTLLSASELTTASPYDPDCQPKELAAAAPPYAQTANSRYVARVSSNLAAVVRWNYRRLLYWANE